jgi:hypothetical protein
LLLHDTTEFSYQRENPEPIGITNIIPNGKTMLGQARKITKCGILMRSSLAVTTLEDVKILAERYGIAYRQPGTSHVTFRSIAGDKLTIPAHKAIYIKQFIALIDGLGENNE